MNSINGMSPSDPSHEYPRAKPYLGEVLFGKVTSVNGEVAVLDCDGFRVTLNQSEMVGDCIEEKKGRLEGVVLNGNDLSVMIIKSAGSDERPILWGSERIFPQYDACNRLGMLSKWTGTVTRKLGDSLFVEIDPNVTSKPDSRKLPPVEARVRVNELLGDSRMDREARLTAIKVGDKVNVKLTKFELCAEQPGKLIVEASEQEVILTYFCDLAGNDWVLTGRISKRRSHDGAFVELQNGGYKVVALLRPTELAGMSESSLKPGMGIRVKIKGVDYSKGSGTIEVTRQGVNKTKQS